MKMQFMGHSPPKNGTNWQTLADHARGVTDLVRQHARFFQVSHADLDAHWLGLTHDLGKYRLEFQHYRLGWNPVTAQPQSYPEKPAPHSDAGAKALCVLVNTQRQLGSELPFVVANHHGGLRDVPRLLGRLSDTAQEEVEELFALACEDIPELATLLETPPIDTGLKGAARTLYTRMLLGALVDADRLDTESHGSPHNTQARAAARASQGSMAQLFARLETAQAEYAVADARNPKAINALRREMYQQATSKAALPPGFFRLTMPTGGGKTLTSLGFALSHAAYHGGSAEQAGMRRVIYGVPFTTIIEQTASVFREVLGEQNVLEHHSNLEFKAPARGQEMQMPDPIRLATENWDAPVIVTTTVQLFQETLFGNRTAQLRKLHNVAGSVIVLDEAQSLPTHRLAPILEALRELVARYHVSVVFCTATQPALDDFPSQQSALELIDHPAHYFQQLQRVDYDLERVRDPATWDALAAELLDVSNDRALCIVNTKKHAQELYRLLVRHRQAGDPLWDVYHLSTHLCPHHRRRIFRVISDRLKKGKRCRVIATNLIEAGVDVDFPRVYRALGPLEAIVQAAGRCNREGKLTDAQGKLIRGCVTVFRPEEHKLPPGDYRVRSDLADRYLAEDSDLHAPDTFTPYFRELYQAVSTDTPIKLESGHRATIAQLQDEMDFEAVARGFEMIEDTTVPVIVRQYAPQEVNHQLNIILNDPRVTQVRAAWRRLQPYTVQVLRRDIKTFDLRVVSELSQKAERFGTEPPEVYEWPLNKRYDLKLGLDTGGMDAQVY
ncbi:CRISPR-associated endonuclease Cas3'' [Deinococcus frigens]|uniref:CRISPR-associated endonuclease Cas3'' n=1 Tax=Deinococcus frigens TaxID=249403 RepID=UPI000691939D|nr:CRISPR-associated endonuclease Cas3'' [Deinococcus frigens]